MNAAEISDKYSPYDVAVALSLYAYNFAPLERAQRIYDHFRGDCAELEELTDLLGGRHGAYAASELAPPSAVVYINHALERYGDEAQRRNRINLDPRPLSEILEEQRGKKSD